MSSHIEMMQRSGIGRCGLNSYIFKGRAVKPNVFFFRLAFFFLYHSDLFFIKERKNYAEHQII